MSSSTQLVPDIESLGQMLRHARREQGLTQVQAAALCAVSPRLWNETERGKRQQLGLDTVLRMLQTMGLDLMVATRHSSVQERTRGSNE